jgi:hypothetical protein
VKTLSDVPGLDDAQRDLVLRGTLARLLADVRR